MRYLELKLHNFTSLCNTLNMGDSAASFLVNSDSFVFQTGERPLSITKNDRNGKMSQIDPKIFVYMCPFANGQLGQVFSCGAVFAILRLYA